MSNQDHLTEELGRELHRRVDALYDTPFSFTDVRGRARQIRRRRRTTAAVAVAAAVAVVAAVPAVLSGSLNRADRPVPAPTPPPTVETAVLHDGQMTLPGGDTVDVDVDNKDVTQFGVLTDGRIVVAMSKPYAVRVYTSEGKLAEQYSVQTNAITMSAGDDAVAWVAEDFTVQVLASGSAEPTTLPGVPMPGESAGSIDAVLDPEHLLGGDWNQTTYELTLGEAQAQDLSTSEPLRVTDVSPDGATWAVDLPGKGTDPQFGCSGLYDPEADRLVATNCDTSNLRFSPDGRHLIGARGDNNMYGEVDMFDLDLQQVGSYAPAKGLVISRVAWADATHVLATVAGLEDNQWSLVSVGLDGGDATVLDGPVAGRNPEMLVEFLPAE